MDLIVAPHEPFRGGIDPLSFQMKAWPSEAEVTENGKKKASTWQTVP